ncbi:hypothetical protein V8C86DRAFT_795157 [Haematococcus lacustris]
MCTNAFRSGKAMAGQVRSRSRQVRSGQVRSGQVRSGQVRSGQVRSGQVRSGQVRSGQVRSGQVRSGQVRSGQVRSGQVRSGQVRSGQVKVRSGQGQVRSRSRSNCPTITCLGWSSVAAWRPPVGSDGVVVTGQVDAAQLLQLGQQLLVAGVSKHRLEDVVEVLLWAPRAALQLIVGCQVVGVGKILAKRLQLLQHHRIFTVKGLRWPIECCRWGMACNGAGTRWPERGWRWGWLRLRPRIPVHVHACWLGQGSRHLGVIGMGSSSCRRGG